MGGVLQRLVDRAVGFGPVGLRPRRPALFEMGGAAGGIEEEQQQEVAAAAPEPGEAARERASDRTHTDLRQHSPEPLLPPTSRNEMREDPAGEIVPSSDVSMPAAEVRAERMVPTTDRAEAVAPPSRLLPEAEQTGGMPPEPPVTNVLQGNDKSAAEPARAVIEAPPTPLLPLAPQATDPGPPAVAPPPARRHEAAPVATDAAPPEITIHIGKLDIRTDPPKAPRPARAARPARSASTMPTLADYLRGSR